MGIVNIVKIVKQAHPKVLILVKVGKFYHAYNKDACILMYFFGYKCKEVDGVKSCGFSEETLNKVVAKLESEKIDYMCLDRRNNYDMDEIVENGNLNRYDDVYAKAKLVVNLKVRIDKIGNVLQENIMDEKVKKAIFTIEELLEGEFGEC